MKTQIDLKAIAKRAIKKTKGQYTSLKVLELFPSKNKTQKSSLEEGTLKLQFPDIGIELRNVIYKIRPEKKVTIILPYKIYPQEGQKLKKGRKIKFVSVDLVSFMDAEVWENVREEIKRQTLELFEAKASSV